MPLKLRVQQCVSWKAVQRFVCFRSWLVSVQEEKFLADQRDYLDSTLKSIIAENKREISETERQCLIKKQALLRGINALRPEHLHRNRFYCMHAYKPSAAVVCQIEKPLSGTWRRRACTRDTSSSNNSWRTSTFCRDTSSSRNTRRWSSSSQTGTSSVQITKKQLIAREKSYRLLYFLFS